jgi:hypothetical protein
MFVFSILFAAYLLEQLGLPEDLLRNVSIALLFAVAATLLFPRLSLLVERSMAPLSRRGSKHIDSGFCSAVRSDSRSCRVAGRSSRTSRLSRPASTSASADRARDRVRARRSVVLLAIALAGNASRSRCAQRVDGFGRRSASSSRSRRSRSSFHVDTKLQTALPNWTNFLQEHTENTAFARDKLYKRKSPSRRRR